MAELLGFLQEKGSSEEEERKCRFVEFTLQVWGTSVLRPHAHPKSKPPRRKSKLGFQIFSLFPDPYHQPQVTENSKGNKNSKGKKGIIIEKR